MQSVKFVDTTLRDGQQSLWALNMSADAMLPVMGDLDAAGFEGIEFTVPGVQFSRSIKDLGENPWSWIRAGAAMVRGGLRMHGTAASPFHPVPTSVQMMLLERLTELGIDVVRFSDPWNDFAQLEGEMEKFASVGMRPIINLIYSESPLHTPAYFVERMKQVVALDPYRVCVKDVGGIMTPETAATLLPALVDAAGGMELEFHAHCSSGLAPLNCQLAVKSGIHIIHTAVQPLANGSSLPSIHSVVRNLEWEGYQCDIDLEPLGRVRDHLQFVARSEGFPEGQPLEPDVRLFDHQVPGGMISNLQFHLRKIGLENRISDILEEVIHVRRELGYPIMVTPLSQFVASQAAMNIGGKERYENVTDEVIQWALGYWGEESVSRMDAGIRDRILDRPRAQELSKTMQRADSAESFDEIRSKFPPEIDDDELIARVYAGVGVEPPLVPRTPATTYEQYRAGRKPLTELFRVLLEADVQAARVSSEDEEFEFRR